jgi:hypothetical protein
MSVSVGVGVGASVGVGVGACLCLCNCYCVEVSSLVDILRLCESMFVFVCVVCVRKCMSTCVCLFDDVR